MNEHELLDSPSTGLRTGLHDGKILAIHQKGDQVIIELDFVDHWEPQEEEGHYVWCTSRPT